MSICGCYHWAQINWYLLGGLISSDSSAYGSCEVISVVKTSASLSPTLIHKPHLTISWNYQMFILGISPAAQFIFTQVMGRNFMGFC